MLIFDNFWLFEKLLCKVFLRGALRSAAQFELNYRALSLVDSLRCRDDWNAFKQ